MHFRLWKLIILSTLLAAGLFIAACGGSTTPGILAPADEGSVTDPVRITLDINGDAQYGGQVGLSNSYYVVNGVTAGDYYHVSLSNISNDVDLYVYESPDFTGSLDSSINPGTADESVIVNTTGADLYIRVQSFDAPEGARFVIVLENMPLEDEGTALAPIKLTNSVTHVGTVGLTNSYYAVAVTNGVYQMTLTSQEGSPDVLYYDGDSNYQDSLYTCSGVSPLWCLVTAHSPDMYLAVNGQGTASGAVYELNVSPYYGQTEGTPDAPVPLTLDSLYNGTVYNTTVDSYYSVGVTSGTSYDVSMTSLSDDADLFVYNALGFGAYDCYNQPSITGTNPEFCTVTATGPELYIRVQSFSFGIVTYILNTTAN